MRWRQVRILVVNFEEIRKKGKGCTWKVKWKVRRCCVGLWRPRLLSEEKNGRSLDPEQPIRDQSELILQVKNVQKMDLIMAAGTVTLNDKYQPTAK
jgi:hypothetical protein